MNKARFENMTKLVIDTLEGGYFHHAMFSDGRLNPKYKSIYAISGETMFGIDRKNYGTANTAFKQFWQLIDAAGARYTWKYNYKGGRAADVLKKLVVAMMLPRYENYSKLYLSDKSRKIVDSDDRLSFHFIYAVWNGAGNFQKFARIFNTAVQTTTDKNKLWAVALKSRRDTGVNLHKQGADKMEKLFGSVNSTKSTKLFKAVGLSLLFGTLAYGGFKIYKTQQNKAITA